MKFNVIIQAGGRGSRLRHHTWNKPKCLVSIDGKPVLYHMFSLLPRCKFYIIGDYLFDTLKEYLKVNEPNVEYELINAAEQGTCSGIKGAKERINNNWPVLLLWSDILISSIPKITLPEGISVGVGVTNKLTCRWSIKDTRLVEEVSSKSGVPGFFWFSDKECLARTPQSGEFVRWLEGSGLTYTEVKLGEIKEIGEFDEIEKNNNREGLSRFFNKITMEENRVIKTVIDPAYQIVHDRERQWYKDASLLGFQRIPQVESYEPLILERIKGSHVFLLGELTKREKFALLGDYFDSLHSLHLMKNEDAVTRDIHAVYIEKTKSRVNGVRNLIPGFQNETVTVNGVKCMNVFSPKYEHILDDISRTLVPKKFTPIHGDCTFSNTIIDKYLKVWFIDPRGYFHSEGIMGDPNYDLAKLYYSAIGGYDQFNRRNFKLVIDNETAEILMEQPGIQSEAILAFNELSGQTLPQIKLIHGLIWLSLAGYVKDDIDSVIASFYLGLYWLQDGIKASG